MQRRIERNAAAEEGVMPSENPENLIKEALSVLKEQESLICKINRTNMHGLLPDGRTLMEMLVHRDCLLQQHAVLLGAIESAQKSRGRRHSRREIKWVKTVDVLALRKQADMLGAQIRKLHAAIEEANNLTELET